MVLINKIMAIIIEGFGEKSLVGLRFGACSFSTHSFILVLSPTDFIFLYGNTLASRVLGANHPIYAISI